MLLEPFDLEAAITNYNQKHKKNVSLKSHFGVIAWRMLATTNAYIHALNYAHYVNRFTADEAHFLSQRNKSLGDMQHKLFGYSSDEERRHELNTSVKATFGQKKQFYDWHQNLHEVLEGLGKRTDLTLSQRQREPLMVYAFHSQVSQFAHSALWKFTDELLPRVANYHAGAHISWWTLAPRDLVQRYNNYCDSLVKHAESLRKQCTESMLVRLEALDASNLENADVCFHTYRELVIRGVMKPLREIHCEPEPLSEQLFANFSQHVWCHGNAKQKKRLKELSWHNRRGMVTVLEKNDGLVIYPDELVQHRLNRWQRYLAKHKRMFAGYAMRRSIVLNSQWVLARLHRSLKISVAGYSYMQLGVYAETTFEVSNQVDGFLNELDKRARELNWYNHSSRRFLKDLKKTIIEKLLRKLVNLVNAVKWYAIDNNGNLSLSECEGLFAIVDRIKASSLRKNEVLNEQIVMLERHLSPILFQNRAYRILSAVADGVIISRKNLQCLIDVVELNINLNSESKLIRIRKLFIELLKSNPSAARSPLEQAEYQAKMEVYLKILQHLDSDFLQTLPRKHIEYYAINYLSYLQKTLVCGRAGNNDVIATFEHMLANIGRCYQFCDMNLVGVVTEIQHLRKENQGSILSAKVNAWLELLIQSACARRVGKDAGKIDLYIKTLLVNDARFTFSDSNIGTFFQVRDQLTDAKCGGDAPVLSAHQQVLLGVEPKIDRLNGLMNLSVNTQFTHRKLCSLAVDLPEVNVELTQLRNEANQLQVQVEKPGKIFLCKPMRGCYANM